MDVKKINSEGEPGDVLFTVEAPKQLQDWPVSSGHGSVVFVHNVAAQCFTTQKEPSEAEKKSFLDAIKKWNGERT